MIIICLYFIILSFSSKFAFSIKKHSLNPCSCFENELLRWGESIA